MSNIQLNSFNQAPRKGQLDMKLNLNVIDALYKETNSGDSVSEGDIVVLSGDGKRIPTVSKATEYVEGNLYGVVCESLKQDTYHNNEVLAVALFGSAIHLQAGEDLDCGKFVYYNFTNGKLTDDANDGEATPTAYIPLGNILNSVKADGLVRVLLR